MIIHGKVATDLDAKAYHDYKPRAMGAVLASWGRLTAEFDCVLVEGAGSPAEINLRDRDIANMGFAEAVDCPVIIVADIDRGGVFAHLVGTLELLFASEQQRVVGFVINRFRGDIALLESGLDWLEQRTGKPVLGVLPYLHGLMLDAEDAIATAAVDTTLVAEKQLRNVSGHLTFAGTPAMTAYEIHLGVTRGKGLNRPVVRLNDEGNDGAISVDEQVLGTYCHGIFDHSEALTALLAWVGMVESESVDFAARREADLDRLADSVEAALDWEKLAGQFEGFAKDFRAAE